MAHEITAENEFGLFIEFNGVVQAELALFLVRELVRIAKLKRHFGPDATIEIVELGRGSLKVTIAILGGLASLAAVGGFALDIEERLTQRTERLSECTAQIILESGAQKVDLITCTGPIHVLKEEMPAVRVFMEGRAQSAHDVTNWHDYFNNPPRTLPDVSPEPTVKVVRTATGEYPTVGGRPVELLDGSKVFGTRNVRQSNVRFLDVEDGVTGIRPGLKGNLQVFGSFEIKRMPGKGLSFRTGDALFEVDLAEFDGVPSIGIPVIANVHVDPQRPNLLVLHGWDAIES